LFVLRTAIATVLLVAFLDSQFAFCSAQTLPKKKLDKLNNKKRKAHGSHDQVSDIEYIIPRVSSSIFISSSASPEREREMKKAR
ncbi:hypothetical protein GWI33_010445, partial [Rhynchophorus ferrugineus]